jgi:cellulose synthase/poly-beta-1,6-N-acetylglucosamine synthase-like glycosyltransferase
VPSDPHLAGVQATAWWILSLAFVAVAYVYFGYPLLLLLTRPFTGRRRPPSAESSPLPRVTMLVAAYNEQEVIEEKIRNSLAIDYPAELLDFVFVSDSTDSTNDILSRAASSRIRVLLLPERQGKVAALHAALPLVTGDLVLFSDANTFYEPSTVRLLARHFTDPRVGLVTGDVRLLASAEPFSAGERLYYFYERWLQQLESDVWSTVAIDGAMYILRRPLLRLASDGRVADDLVTGMNVGCQGFRMIYDPEAGAKESPTPSGGEEFSRKARVVAYAVQSLMAAEGVPGLRRWKLLWIFLSHKVLRWLVPFFLLLALGASFLLAGLGSPLGRLVALVQAAFYFLAWLGWRIPQARSLLFRVPYYFTMVNAAALVGVFRGLLGRQRPAWARTRRSAENV